MKKILIIAFSNLEKDPRVRRQIEYLSNYYKISTIGYEPVKIDEVEFFKILPKNRSIFKKIKNIFDFILKRYNKLHTSFHDYQSLVINLKKRKFDLIIVNDIEPLPFVFEQCVSTPVICDIHEYAPSQFDHVFRWRVLYKSYNVNICLRYLNKCNYVFTVSKGIADEYKRVFGIDASVMTNASEYKDLRPCITHKSKIRLIHHGVAQPFRKLENMIEIMKYADKRFILDLMLTSGNIKYLKSLRKLVNNLENVNIVSPVPMTQITRKINSYDIGIYFLEPLNFNYKMALPNKIFEYIQARLAVVVGPSQEMAHIVRKHNCGIVINSYNPIDIAISLNKITLEQINLFKHNAHIAARELNSQKNMEKLGQVVLKLLDF